MGQRKLLHKHKTFNECTSFVILLHTPKNSTYLEYSKFFSISILGGLFFGHFKKCASWIYSKLHIPMSVTPYDWPTSSTVSEKQQLLIIPRMRSVANPLRIKVVRFSADSKTDRNNCRPEKYHYFINYIILHTIAVIFNRIPPKSNKHKNRQYN